MSDIETIGKIIYGLFIGIVIDGVIYFAFYEALCELSKFSCNMAFIAFIIIPAITTLGALLDLYENIADSINGLFR